MTLLEWVRLLPDEERTKLFQALIEVSEAGRRAGAAPQEWAQQYVDTYNWINLQLEETSNG